MPIFETTALSRKFRTGDTEIQALKQVSMRIARTKLSLVMGASGCGKTTLLHILGLMDPDYDGSFRYDGCSVNTLSDRSRTQRRLSSIGFVFQNFNLLPTLSVQANVALPHWHLHGNRKNARDRASELLTQLGLGNRLAHLPPQLSAGEIQRACVARAMVNRPTVLIADEPTAHLDEAATHHLGQIFQSLTMRGCTVVVASHDLSLKRYADCTLNLSFGSLVTDTTAAGKEN
jgi:ABC-type lipoprotein export system ATPase subunit